MYCVLRPTLTIIIAIRRTYALFNENECDKVEPSTPIYCVVGQSVGYWRHVCLLQCRHGISTGIYSVLSLIIKRVLRSFLLNRGRQRAINH